MMKERRATAKQEKLSKRALRRSKKCERKAGGVGP
jgi:hypothetical protein